MCYFSVEGKLKVYFGVRICVLFVLFACAGVSETPKFTLMSLYEERPCKYGIHRILGFQVTSRWHLEHR